MTESLANGLPLGDWESFYVIVGTSAAALTGLTFIVITITAEGLRNSGDSFVPEARLAALRAFISPTVVHFCSTLLLSALLSAPPLHTARSLAICLGLGGIAGVAYCMRVGYWMFKTTRGYMPFASDWLWNVVLPSLTYLAVLVAAALLGRNPDASLDLIGALTLALLFLGLRNAWDVVVWMTTERHVNPDSRTPPAVKQSASEHGSAQVTPPQP